MNNEYTSKNPRTSVPPTAVTKGEVAGKEGTKVVQDWSYDPPTPESPEAKRIEIPLKPCFLNSVLTLCI